MRILSFILIATLFMACNQPPQQQNASADAEKNDTPVIGKNELKLQSPILTPEVLWSFGRVGGLSINSAKDKLVYGVSYYSIDQNRGNRELFVYDIPHSKLTKITNTATGEYQAQWNATGDKLYYLSAQSGQMQVWQINADGTNPKQITEIQGGIEGFAFSPNQTKLLYVAKVKIDENVNEKYSDLPKANARIIDELMYRHWDTWHDYTYNHVFVADFDGTTLTNATDIMQGQRFDCPTKPFGGMEQIAWSPDSKKLVYTTKQLTGKEYALSTNTDLFLYDTQTKQTTNLTEGMMGYDMDPVFSNNGEKLAWTSMERDGFEADKTRLFVLDFASGKKTYITENFDQSVSALQWSPDDTEIYFISGTKATYQIYKTGLSGQNITALTAGTHNYQAFALGKNLLFGLKQSMSMPTELFAIAADKTETNISNENKHLLDQLKFGKVEERWITTTDNKQMLTWVIYPPNFDASKKYPTLLYCQGGPQSAVSQFFSFRWNFQMMAANDYIIVAPNRRGLPTFGQEWNDQISGDYGGQNMQDYLAAIDALAKEPFVDDTRLGAVGASYGGFSVLWLAGNHNKRFKAFIEHDGIFNFESMYGSTEELFFVDWDMGGPYWNPRPKNSYSASPHKFVQNWDTPILIIHGGKDFRIPETQAMSAFTAAQLQNVPSKFLYFPEENHWVLKPQNGILWQREFFGWLNQWLKEK